MTQSTIKTAVDTANAALTIVTDAGGISVQLGDLSDDIIRQLALHGLKQKICDAAAIPRNTETGRSASVEEKFAAMQRVANSLLAGEWGVKRGEGDGVSGQSLLFRALQRLYPDLSADDVRTKIAGWDKKQQAAIRKNARVAPIILELQAEDAARTTTSGGIDTDAMLDELAG